MKLKYESLSIIRHKSMLALLSLAGFFTSMPVLAQYKYITIPTTTECECSVCECNSDAITELEGTWTRTIDGNLASYYEEYVFSGSGYNYISIASGTETGCDDAGLPYPCELYNENVTGIFFIGRSFLDQLGEEVTEIVFIDNGTVKNIWSYLLGSGLYPNTSGLQFGDICEGDTSQNYPFTRYN